MNQEIAGIVAAQKLFFKEGTTLPIAFRLRQLKALRELIKQNEGLITQALQQDLGKSAFESYATEIGIVLEELGVFIRKTTKWAQPKSVSNPIAAFPSRSFIHAEPRGVCLIIAPWNYPFQLAIAPLVAAIAAGNCAIIKPSELSTATASVMQNLINKAFDSNYIHVITGDAAVSQELLKQAFDMFFFTGSPRVGKIVMKAAAEQLIPVVLELGGKSPVVVDSSVDIKLAARRIMWGKSINAGQTCIAPDYVLAEKSIANELIEAMKAASIAMFGDHPQQSPDYPRIINEANVIRLKQMLGHGRVAFGGEADLADRFIPLTVLTEPDLNAALMQEEIFGPLLPVVTFEKLEEALQLIGSKPKPLALYVFSKNRKAIRTILSKVSAGGVTINDTIMHFTNGSLPFGGAGYSGIGSYHGKAGFEAFSHLKPIMKRATWLDIPLRYPPFGNKLQLVKTILK